MRRSRCDVRALRLCCLHRNPPVTPERYEWHAKRVRVAEKKRRVGVSILKPRGGVESSTGKGRMVMASRSIGRLVAITAVVLCSGIAGATTETRATRVASPGGRLAVYFRLDAEGVPRYAIRLDGKPVLRESRLGLVRDDADFSRGLRLVSASRAVPVRERYEILTAKRRVNDYRANRMVFRLQTAAGPEAGDHLPGLGRRRGFPLSLPGDERGDAAADRGGHVVQLPAGHAGVVAADVGGQERLGESESLLRGVLRERDRRRDAVADRRGLGLPGALPHGRHLGARERERARAQLQRHAAAPRVAGRRVRGRLSGPA